MLEFIFGIILISVFILFQLIYRRNQTSSYGAPFVPLTPDVVNTVMEIADIKNNDVFYDLGSGDGRLVIAAALRGARAYGVEIDKYRVWYSRVWITLLGLSKNATIIQTNIFDVDLSGADIVTAYLLQETNDKLEPKLDRELKKGTRVIGIAFNFPSWKPKKVDPRGPVYGPVYLYEKP
jgi:hypothetical protein